MIRFRALGAVDLTRSEGQSLRSVLSQPKRLALLAYLVIGRPRGFHRRDRLLAMFWPDATEERARASLNRAIYFLRQQLGERCIISRGDDEVAIDAEGLWSDVSAFDECLEKGLWREALELYRGDLLPGFFTSDANGFEEWLESERAYLRNRASHAAWALANKAESNGDIALAATWARRGVELAPFGEPELRHLLVLLDAAGDRAGASEAYQRFAARLAGQLELTPAPETQVLIGEIQSREVATAPEIKRANPNGDPPPPVTVGATSPQPIRRRRWAIAAAVALVAVTTPAILLARVNRRTFDAHRVYVARFANLTSDPNLEPLGRIAADRVTQALNATGLLEIAAPSASGDSIAGTSSDARQAFVLQQADRWRAGLVVSGEIQRDGPNLTIQAWITDIVRGRVVWLVAPVAAPIDSAQRAIEEIRERAAGAVVTLNTPRFAGWLPIASLPPRLPAFQEFASGVDLQLRGADRDALDHLRRAVALDSSFTWARLQLAQAHHALYEATVADSIAVALDKGRERLMPLQRHVLDWMLALRVEDRLGAYRAISDAASLVPDVFQFMQSDAAFRLNRPREAAALLERLGPSSPYNHEVEYWSALGRAYHALEDRKRELSVARQARERYPDRINVLSSLLTALAAQGKVTEVSALLDSALAFPRPKPEAQGVVLDMWGLGFWPGRLMMTAATEFRAHGFDSAADATFKRAIAWYRTLEQADVPEVTHEFEHARLLYFAREWSAAGKKFKVLAAADPNNIVYDGFLGVIAARLGDTSTARVILAKFEQRRPGLERPHAIAGYWIARINGVLGDEAAAMRGLRECFGPQGHPGVLHEMDLESLRNSREFREFTRPKD